MSNSGRTSQLLTTCLIAILIPIAVAVGWNEIGPLLQNSPGYFALLLIAVIARFAGFLPSMAATLGFAVVFWFYLLPATFAGESLRLLIFHVAFFVLAATMIASISRERAAEVRDLEEMYRSLVELAPEAIGVSNEQGRIVFTNNALARLMGAVNRAELIGKRTLDFVHPDFQDVIRKRIEELAAGKIAPPLEVKWITLGGRTIDVETTGIPVHKDGKVFYQGFVRDLTQRKINEAAVQALFNAAIDAIFCIDSTGRFVNVNPAVSNLLGYTRDELLAMRVGDLTPLGKKAAISGIWKAAQAGESVRGEFTIKGKEGKIHEVEYATISNILPGTHAAFLHDVTARNEAERSVRQLSGRLLRMQDEERRRIARQLHDTTAQNLAALKLNLSKISRSPSASDSSIREPLDESMALTDRSIAEIRTLAYLLHPPMIEEAGLLPSLRWYAQGFEARSGIHVTLDFPKELERLSMELETALYRIVQEALTNIQRHSGSTIATIRIERQPQALQLKIEDEGRGIPPIFRDHESALGASGVGIAGMRERVSELGGRMQIQSREKGTVVSVTLPISQT